MSTSRITSRSRRSSSTAMISPLNSPPAKPTTSSCTGPIDINVSSSSLRSAGQQLLLGLVELLLREHALVHQTLELDELGGDVGAAGRRGRRGGYGRRGRRRGRLGRLLLGLLRLQLLDLRVLVSLPLLVRGDVLAGDVCASADHRGPHQRA